MKYFLKRSSDRIYKKDAWKESWYAFVPYQTNFGELCGFADDIVQPGKGFGMHPHQNMEISTIVLSGSQAHKDDTGSEGIVDGNSVQTMSAGKGILHSEYNASNIHDFHSYQIWVYPKMNNVAPRHAKFVYQPQDKLNKLLLALSPDERNGSKQINQDAFFSLSLIEANTNISYAVRQKGNGVYIHCAIGVVEIAGQHILAGDAIGVYETEIISILAHEAADLIFVEVPMERGITL